MPLYNIFSKKRKSKTKPKQIPTIVADIHETNSLVISELKASKQINLQIKPLKIADYLIGNTAIERKTTSDFISSMINRRLFQQLKQMQKYKEKLLIIEGDLDLLNNETNLNSNSIRGFIISIINNHQIPIIQTQDYEDTAQYLITLAKQQLKPKIPISFHSRIPKTIKEQKQYIIESFPNIGPKKAELLLKKFKTINNIINATEEELNEILKNSSTNFKEIINSES
jgi:ERCC4-type nuclease